METTNATKAVVAKKKKKTNQNVPVVKMYVQASFNNTIMTATDLQGNTLAWSSAGSCGFKGPKKSTPYAATTLTKTVLDNLKAFGVKDAHVFLKGIGSGREAAVRALHSNGINVISIKDLTPIPHNGCRRRKERRV